MKIKNPLSHIQESYSKQKYFLKLHGHPLFVGSKLKIHFLIFVSSGQQSWQTLFSFLWTPQHQFPSICLNLRRKLKSLGNYLLFFSFGFNSSHSWTCLVKEVVQTPQYFLHFFSRFVQIEIWLIWKTSRSLLSQNLTSWGGVCTSPANTIPNRLTTTTNTQNMQSRIRTVGSLVEEVLSLSRVILTSLTMKLLEDSPRSPWDYLISSACSSSHMLFRVKRPVASGWSTEVNEMLHQILFCNVCCQRPLFL